MKKIYLPILCSALFFGANAQQAVQDSVKMGANYVNEVYYKLNDGTKSEQAANNWHVGFGTSMQTPTIISNPSNTKVYIWPNGTNADFATVDTVGINTWPELTNAHSNFVDGSFNSNIDSSNTAIYAGQQIILDNGWGVYNPSTHILTGDSVYILKIGTAAYKLDIVKKQYGVVSLRFADVSVAQGTDASFNVTDYNTKNFVFFNVIDGQVKDRELQDWDLWAVKYHDFYSAMGQSGTMVVTGILTNPKWKVAAVQVGAGNQATSFDYSGAIFSTDKNIIGSKYKAVNYQTGQVEVTDSTVYYLQNEEGDIWKWYPTRFVGAAAGLTEFYKQHVAFAGLTQEGTTLMEIYPNPVQTNATIVLDAKSTDLTLTVRNQMGQVVAQKNVTVELGVTSVQLDLATLTNGMYFVEMTQNNHSVVKSLVKN